MNKDIEVISGMTIEINKLTREVVITKELNEVYLKVFDLLLYTSKLLAQTLSDVKEKNEEDEFMAEFVAYYISSEGLSIDGTVHSVDLNELYKYIYGSYLDNVFGD